MPTSETAKPLPANPEAVATLALLGVLDHAVTVEQQQGLIASAGVRAQLAVAYELNTIGRILAQTAEIITPVANTNAAADQHNAILERLGL